MKQQDIASRMPKFSFKMPYSGRLLGARPEPVPKDGIALGLRAFEVFRDLPKSAEQAAQAAQIISGRSPYPVVCFPWILSHIAEDGQFVYHAGY